MYYGTGEMIYFTYVYYGYGLYKSTDGGNSFYLAGQGLPFPCYIAAIAIKPDQKNVVLAAIGSNYTNWNYSSGLYRSTDYGETFIQIVPGNGSTGLVCTDVAFSPDGSKAYIVGPQQGHPNLWDNGVGYRISTDGGQTFYSYDDRVSVESLSKLSICQSSPDNVYIITNNVDAQQNYYIDIDRSQDGGFNYTRVVHQIETDQYSFGQPYYNLCIKVHPDNPLLVYWGVCALEMSNDGCATFHKIGGYDTPVHPDMHSIDLISGDQNTVLVCCDGGCYSSNNQGNSWNDLNSTLTLTQFYRMSANPSNLDNMLACAQDNGMQKKESNYSHIWDDAEGGDMGTVRFNQLNSNYCLAKNCWTGDFYLSQDGGNSFGSTTSIYGSAWIPIIVWHPTSENIAYTHGKFNQNDPLQWIMSSDNGNSWGYLLSDFPNTVAEQLAISNSNPSVMFASTGSFSFWPTQTSKLYKTTNNGSNFVNWTDLHIMDGSNALVPNRYISRIAVNPLNENNVFVVLSGFGSGHVWQSWDGGNVWKNCSSNLPDVPINDILVFPDWTSDYLDCIVATDCGVFISWGDLRKWMEVAAGLPNSIALDLDLKANSTLLRVATHGRGVWEFDFGGESSNIVNKPEKKYLLYQNSPNPFNPSTTISYEIPRDLNVTIKIYDIIGREVVTLVNNEFKKAGKYSVQWNASNYASGVYFYKLDAGDFRTVKKMVLMK